MAANRYRLGCLTAQALLQNGVASLVILALAWTILGASPMTVAPVMGESMGFEPGT